MRPRFFSALICSLAIVVTSARMSFAGVVMAETSTETGPDGQSNSQVKTIYLQGNKQKVERQDVAAITDLDKNIIYIVDKQHHDYAQIPLEKLHPSPPDNGPGQRVTLDRTPTVRTVANHHCREYRASEGDKLEHVTISACLSTDAPGARELSEFERKMIARLAGQDSPPPPENQAGALMLEKQSVVSLRIPDPSQHRLYRTASLSAKTRVNQIQVKPLSPETFQPPKGFNQLPSRPGSVPRDSPGIGGHAIEVATHNSPARIWAANL